MKGEADPSDHQRYPRLMVRSIGRKAFSRPVDNPMPEKAALNRFPLFGLSDAPMAGPFDFNSSSA